jgi:hypothetical protein
VKKGTLLWHQSISGFIPPLSNVQFSRQAVKKNLHPEKKEVNAEMRRIDCRKKGFSPVVVQAPPALLF